MYLTSWPTEKKADDAKRGWFSWLGWGKQAAQDAVDELKRRAGETEDAFVKRFEEAKRRAAEKGEDVRRKANETEEDFRRRIENALRRS